MVLHFLLFVFHLNNAYRDQYNGERIVHVAHHFFGAWKHVQELSSAREGTTFTVSLKRNGIKLF